MQTIMYCIKLSAGEGLYYADYNVLYEAVSRGRGFTMQTIMYCMKLSAGGGVHSMRSSIQLRPSLSFCTSANAPPNSSTKDQ